MLEEGYREGTQRPILPDLNDNIKHGNSIIDNDIFLEDDIEFDSDILHPFDWVYAFPEVMETGGFDLIVGNPPYIRLQIFEELYGKDIVRFLKENYITAKKFNFDIYVVFIEKGINLARNKGIVTYIIPNKLVAAPYAQTIRKKIANNRKV